VGKVGVVSKVDRIVGSIKISPSAHLAINWASILLAWNRLAEGWALLATILGSRNDITVLVTLTTTARHRALAEVRVAINVVAKWVHGREVLLV